MRAPSEISKISTLQYSVDRSTWYILAHYLTTWQLPNGKAPRFPIPISLTRFFQTYANPRQHCARVPGANDMEWCTMRTARSFRQLGHQSLNATRQLVKVHVACPSPCVPRFRAPPTWSFVYQHMRALVCCSWCGMGGKVGLEISEFLALCAFCRTALGNRSLFSFGPQNHAMRKGTFVSWWPFLSKLETRELILRACPVLEKVWRFPTWLYIPFQATYKHTSQPANDSRNQHEHQPQLCHNLYLYTETKKEKHLMRNTSS